MGLFSRKPKVGIEQFCREFYDSQIFHPIIADTDVGSVFFETVFNSVVEADHSFARVKRATFDREMTALRMELFGLAWCHRFKREEFTIPQSLFTKRYLEENGKLEIWDTMGEYNQAIAISSDEIVTGERRRAWVVSMNKLRSDLFDKWVEAGVDPKCVARALNRIGSDESWKKGTTLRRLTARLAARLRCRKDLESEAFFRLEAVIFGLYEGAEKAIKSVNLQV